MLQYKTWPNRYQLEKDYLQYMVLFELFKHTKTGLVFKGGTALQKCYGLDRFSEDLDFTADSDDTVRTMEEGLKQLKKLYDCTFTKDESPISISFNLKIKGPLFEKPQSIQTILIEVSRREKVLAEPILIKLVPIYRDLEAHIIVVMNKDEILAEKTRALLTRRRPRDLYDAYFLLRKDSVINFGLINKKLEYYKIKFDMETLNKRIMDLEGQWGKELGILMAQVPDFKEISKNVLNSFEEAYNGFGFVETLQ